MLAQSLKLPRSGIDNFVEYESGMSKFETFSSLISPDKKVCPYYMVYTFDNILRKLAHNPKKILSAHIKEGDVVADIGCGIGYFSIPMAKLVGPKGKVFSVDLQAKMLEGVRKRAKKANVLDRICFHQVTQNNIDLKQGLDFALAFWVIHEVPDTKMYLTQIIKQLKPGAKFLFAEPIIHVDQKHFSAIKNLCLEVGFKVLNEPKIFFSRAVLLVKPYDIAARN